MNKDGGIVKINSKLIINKMDSLTSEEVLLWEYSETMKVLGFSENNVNHKILGKGQFYSVRDSEYNLLGYYCFCEDAKLKSGYEYNVYDDFTCTDIGVALNPELCNKGYGFIFLVKALEFARDNFYTDMFRTTVPIYNKRAIRIYEKAGFSIGKVFEHIMGNKKMKFAVMTVTL